MVMWSKANKLKLLYVVATVALSTSISYSLTLDTVLTDDLTFFKVFFIHFLTFQTQDSPTELAFKYAVYKINKDPHILANRWVSLNY